jgi:REP element-mobilizing transposase RayT
MNRPGLHKNRRHLPHWQLPGSTYFVTFRLKRGELTPEERRLVFDHIRHGDPRFYRLLALVVMPDHVHLVARPNEEVALSAMMKGIKGVSARRINERRHVRGPLWQDESHDRIVRDAEEAAATIRYLRHNPVRAGLVHHPLDYPFTYLRP